MTTALSSPSTGAPALPVTPVGSAERIRRIMRLQLLDRWTFIWIPLLVLGTAFVISVGISYLIWTATSQSQTGEAEVVISGLQAPLWYLLSVGIQLVAGMFHYCLGIGISRGEYFKGSMAFFLTFSGVAAVLMTLLSLVEEATAGWWIGAKFFTSFFLDTVNPLQRFLIFLVAQLFMLTVGFLIGTIFLRWRTPGVLLAILLLVLALTAAFAAVLLSDGWMALGAWFAANGVFGTVMWLLLPAVLAAALSYRVLRGSTAR